MSKHEEILSKYVEVFTTAKAKLMANFPEGCGIEMITKENALKAMQEVEDSCPKWVCVADRLPATNEEVYLRGYPRLDKGWVLKGKMLGQEGEYISFYEKYGILSSYTEGHEELKRIFWLEEPKTT